jgi:spermidine synthase
MKCQNTRATLLPLTPPLGGGGLHEEINDFGELHVYSSRILVEEQSEFQKLSVFENPILGKVLGSDGVPQTSEAEENIYHEMMTHVPMFAHGNVKSVLIIGGGDGGILRCVLDHKTVERAVMAEIDEAVPRLVQQHIPAICGNAFRDPRTELKIMDGFKYVQESTEKFDLIVCDSTDAYGPGRVLFGDEFLQLAKQRLNPGGIYVNQNATDFVHYGEEMLVTTVTRSLRRQYQDVWFFRTAVPLYWGGDSFLGWATDNTALRQTEKSVIEKRYADSGIKTKYYNPDMHMASFALPNSVLAMMDKA